MRHALKIIKVCVLLALLVLVAYAFTMVLHFGERLAIGKLETVGESSFYDTTSFDMAKVKPGELLRSEQLRSAPDGMSGWRVLYGSTDRNGNTIVASGLMASPSKQSAQDGKESLPLIVWGHPTTGIAPRCAPSVGIDPFDSIEGLRAIVGAGYSVVAPDYSGMGAEGPASFLIGESEARTTIDIARAANANPKVNASNEIIAWGHSQGGHAALFTGQLAPVYAPELSVKGIAVAAPATDLLTLIDDDIDTIAGVTIGSYAFHSYSQSYGANLNTIVTKQAQAVIPDAAQLCLLGQNKQLHALTQPLIGDFLSADIRTTQPWADLLQLNTPTGADKSVPLFVAQGQRDTLIHPAITSDFVKTQQQRGVNVTYLPLPNASHATVALESIPGLLKWLKTTP